MKMGKKILAMLLCLTLVAAASMVGMGVSAEGKKESVDGVRWFPADMTRNNGYDDLYEVDCGEGLLQRFNEADSNPDAAEPWLSTTFDENGALTLKRTGADGKDFYWPRIRTCDLEIDALPALDLSTANTLYFDFTASESWSILFRFNGQMDLKINKAICEAMGTASLNNTDEDGVAGTYKGSVNLNDVIESIASDSSDPHSTEMATLNKVNKTYVPQFYFFVVGSQNATATINSLYISSADDANGEKCDWVCQGLAYGDEVYDLMSGDDDADDTDDADDADADVSDATTTAKKVDASADAMPGWVLPVIIVAIVVVAAVVVVVVITRKKKAQ